MSRTRKEIHDALRAEMPEVSCIDNCPFCEGREASKEESVSEKIYDQDTVDTLVAAARQETAQETRAGTDAELVTLQASLKDKETALEAAEARVQELEGQIEERDEAIRLAALADERAEKVSAVTELSEEQVEARKEGWAQMDEESFDQVLADFEAATESAKAQTTETPKTPKTNLSFVRETAGEGSNRMEVLKGVLSGAGARS